MAEMPTPDFAVPYAAPKQVKTMAEVQPMAPKKGWTKVSSLCIGSCRDRTRRPAAQVDVPHRRDTDRWPWYRLVWRLRETCQGLLKASSGVVVMEVARKVKTQDG